MPHKPATTTRQPRRNFPTTARKSNSTTPVALPHLSTASTASTAAILPPPTVARETRSPHATALAPQTQPQGQQQALAPNWGLANSDSLNIDDNRNEGLGNSIEPGKPGIEQFGPEKIFHIETGASVESGGGGMSMADPYCAPEGRSQLQAEGSVEPVTRPDNAVDGVAGPGKVKKIIVKKVVRVVKKVVKKRVPKRVLTVLAEESEVTKSSDFDNKSNSVDVLIEKPGIVSEAEDTLDTADEVAENSNVANDIVNEAAQSDEVLEEAKLADNKKSEVFVNCANVSEPVSRENGKDASGSVFSESARERIMPDNDESGLNTLHSDNMKSDDSVTCAPDTMEVEKVDCISKHVVETAEGDNGTIRSNEGSVLGEEKEALERKERRKTEIFVGGLEGYTKEEDIRKVFEEFGAIMEVRLLMSNGTGRNRGYAFVRFESADGAKNALAKYSYAEICGKQCNVEPSGGNDTIYLGNIDKNWKTKDLMTLLEKDEIKNIGKVTLKPDPNNVGKNRGFAFLEFKTSKAAQTAFDKLQKKNILGKNLMVEVAWAQPLNDPDEEESKTSNCFQNKDAAPTCIEAVTTERLHDHGSKVNKAIPPATLKPKSNQINRTTPGWTTKQLGNAQPKAVQNSIKLHEPRHEWKPASSSYDGAKIDNGPSVTNELVQILRQQASNRHFHPQPQSKPLPRTGGIAPDLHFPSPGSKRPFSLVGHDPRHLELWGQSRARIESSYPILGPSSSSLDANALPIPGHPQQMPALTLGTRIGTGNHPSHFQIEEPFAIKLEASGSFFLVCSNLRQENAELCDL
ncbi:RNA-binding (RRM/RBD/RNP motifs) family protein [Striga asiatica]|uniref:RNA-binding (RRM/RBD/RNP motifs) family protein n=1 Tax=Striga asiatica TaxID=4170 RepID=A0A5A7QL77_STRAF|nr:RNA-binding (RRM/RBD/RNP motifs) family protein [Striga asiatica]